MLGTEKRKGVSCGAGSGTHGQTHARQVLYSWFTTPIKTGLHLNGESPAQRSSITHQWLTRSSAKAQCELLHCFSQRPWKPICILLENVSDYW